MRMMGADGESAPPALSFASCTLARHLHPRTCTVWSAPHVAIRMPLLYACAVCMCARRCVFEDAISRELIVRLSAYPKMLAVLTSLPPKLLLLSIDRPPEPIQASKTFRASELSQRCEQVSHRIRRAKFTGRGDRSKVLEMYTSYVERITRALQRTLAMQQIRDMAETDLPGIPVIEVPASPPLQLAAGQLILRRDEPVDAPAGNASSSSARWRLCSVGDDSQQGGLLVGTPRKRALSWDEMSLAVLPWRCDEQAALELIRLKTAARLLQSIAQQLRDVLSDHPGRGDHGLLDGTRGILELLRGAPPNAVTSRLEAGLSSYVTQLHEAHTKLEGGEGLTDSERDELRWEVGADRLRVLIPSEKIADELADALGSLCVRGLRCYARGQALSVCLPDGNGQSWIDAEVLHAHVNDGSGPHDREDRTVRPLGSHELQLSDGHRVTLQLHPWNHAPALLPQSAFAALSHWWLQTLRAQHSHVIDALSGKRFDVLEQCVSIDVSTMKDAAGLSEWLLARYAARCKSAADANEPACALLTAGPAAGKTCLMSQLVVHVLASGSGLLPIFIKVHVLQRQLLDHRAAFSSGSNFIDVFLRLEHAEAQPELYRMLRQAMFARRALLLLDGLDEGGQLREVIERHVAEVLAPQGHLVLATSRPAGVVEARFRGFARLNLSPLSQEQQHAVIRARLGRGALISSVPSVRADANALAMKGDELAAQDFLLSKVPVDLRQWAATAARPDAPGTSLSTSWAQKSWCERLACVVPYLPPDDAPPMDPMALTRFIARTLPVEAATGERITSNPLVLSMVISTYELRLGHAMPSSLVELYEDCTSAFLERAGEPDEVPKFDSALKAIFFVAHSRSERVITDKHFEAARKLGAGTAVELIRQRLLEDKMPLLSMLQADPLRVQASHLSFQEFFVARAICEGEWQLERKPWQLDAFWANTLKIGMEMDTEALKLGTEARFVNGFRRATGTLVSHGRFALGQPPRRGGARAHWRGRSSPFKGGDKATALIAIKLLIGGLVDLSLYDAQLGEDGMHSLRDALALNATLTSLNVSHNFLRAAGVAHLCSALNNSQTLRSLDLCCNHLGAAGASHVTRLLMSRRSITYCNLDCNGLGDTGAVLLAKVVGRGKAPELLLRRNTIGVRGANALEEGVGVALRMGCRLRPIDLSENGTSVVKVVEQLELAIAHQMASPVLPTLAAPSARQRKSKQKKVPKPSAAALDLKGPELTAEQLRQLLAQANKERDELLRRIATARTDWERERTSDSTGRDDAAAAAPAAAPHAISTLTTELHPTTPVQRPSPWRPPPLPPPAPVRAPPDQHPVCSLPVENLEDRMERFEHQAPCPRSETFARRRGQGGRKESLSRRRDARSGRLFTLESALQQATEALATDGGPPRLCEERSLAKQHADLRVAATMGSMPRDACMIKMGRKGRLGLRARRVATSATEQHRPRGQEGSCSGPQASPALPEHLHRRDAREEHQDSGDHHHRSPWGVDVEPLLSPAGRRALRKLSEPYAQRACKQRHMQRQRQADEKRELRELWLDDSDAVVPKPKFSVAQRKFSDEQLKISAAQRR